jgi:hypothetical protein
MNVIVVTAVYRDPYETYDQKEIIGVCSTQAIVDNVIQSYKDRKIRKELEFLLVDTTFETKVMVLDEIRY